MKRIALFSAIVISTLSFAQKTNTTNAAMAYKSYEQSKGSDMEQAAKDLLEAKTYIDLAAVHVETQNDPKTLMYLGKIYIEIPIFGGMSGDAALKAVDPEEALKKGFESFKKSKELDAKEMYVDAISEYCSMYRAIFSNMGITTYDEGKYTEAMAGLIMAATFGEAMGLKDSVFFYYGGLAAFNVEEWETSKDALTRTVEWGYELPASVYYLSQSYYKLGDTLGAEKMLKEQVAKHPKNIEVTIELINLYKETNRKSEAIVILNNAIALDPKNPILFAKAGFIYENMDNFTEAEAAYLKSMELGNKLAGFSLGGLYFNKGVDIYTEANKLTFGTPEYVEKYDKLIEESKVYFQKSLPYLEAAAVDTPKDLFVLEALKAAYAKLQMQEKFLETKKRIEEIKAGQ